ncbi:pyridoxamine 5'-phosphate oxidase family protein [Paraburkholderia sp.]|uniref:pyridoxamine 5'-phosphate oxidase family protein n=1 Tax=Paraburkholderia sp. TaxID=1926495 RepID=UPI0023967645|nr:pyridoxamine 5'-phosphate oxidase family protein [Paraburkholderia sp.]MDE1180552.1 pyridoxamine 5'-phosphate oxidase family protein [Paraburkholderia sp.]
MNAPHGPLSPRSRVKRLAERADYERATLDAIVDAAYVCHVAFVDQRGTHCIPTACWRIGDHLYIHGSNGSQMLKAAVDGAQLCVTITHLDGLVLARSAFNHSMNYRAAVIYGVAEKVDEARKGEVLDALVEKIAHGRSAEARRANAKELAATTVLSIALDEYACKVSTGGPNDDEADLDLAVWAGVLPLALTPQAARPAASANGVQIDEPSYVSDWARA